jgi:hypothetical protein
MTVQRVPQVPFAQIANAALRDKRLSFKARGILALVLSHSGEWSATKRWLDSQSDKDGRAAIQTALNELTELGYREVIHERFPGGIRTVVVWRHETEGTISCRSGNLTVRKPDRQETESALEHNSSEHNSSEHNDEQYEVEVFSLTEPPERPVVSGLPALRVKVASGPENGPFEAFWATYPRRAGKGAARKAWESAIGKASWQEILLAASTFAADPNRDPEFTPHPATWLNQERWNDDPLPAKSRKATGGDAKISNYQTLYEVFGREELENE